MKPNTSRLLPCLVLLMGLAPLPVAAQGWFDVPGLMLPVIQNPCPGGECSTTDEDLPADPAPPSRPTAQQLRFSPDPRQRVEGVSQLIAAIRRNDPQTAAQLEALQGQPGIFPMLDAALAPYGMHTNDLGDAYAFWWLAVWGVYAGDTEETSVAQAQAVVRQSRKAMLATPDLADLPAAQKQRMADQLLLQGVLLEGALETIRANPSMKPQLSAAAAQQARQMGVDLSAMRLTANGFEPVASAANAVAPTGPEPTAPAFLQRNPAQAPIAAGDAGSLIDRVVFYMWGDMQFHPTVLLKDGTAYDVDGPSLEAFPPERARATYPGSWGRWQSGGQQLTLIDGDGSRSDWKLAGGGLYQSFPAHSGQTLNATYERVSGTQVGEMSMLQTGRMLFRPDGTFIDASDFAASSPGAQSGVSMAGGSSRSGGGTYQISGHRIVLRHRDGRHEDLFFGYGSKGTPPRLDDDMIFIGRTAYVKDD